MRVALALHISACMSTHLEIDTAALAHVYGGNGSAPSPEGPASPPAERTWGQVAADYTSACVSSATNAAIFQGRPTSMTQLAVTAGLGCAMGVANRAAQDWAESYRKP